MTTWTIEFEKFNIINKKYYAKAIDILQPIDIPPCEKVSDAMIEYYLANNNFIDTRQVIHKGFLDTDEHHAQRIASLIHLLRSGVELDPVTIYCIYIDDKVFKVDGIDDGWHRMRASIYLDKPIVFHLDFNE